MERTFVLIFFFWAVLTIITPTLIILSENSKPKLDLNGQNDEVIKVRKMMLYIEKYSTKIPIALAPKEAPAPAPAPAPTPISAVPYWAKTSSKSSFGEARKAMLMIFSKEQ